METIIIVKQEWSSSNTFSYDTYLNKIGPAKKKAWNTLLNR